MGKVNPREAFKALKEIKKKKKEERKLSKLEKQKQVLTEDLYKKQIKVGREYYPYIKAFAYDLLNKYFDGIDKMDLKDITSLGIVIYVLENQDNKELLDIEKAELQKRGKIRLMDLPVPSIPNYISGISEMFEDVKKKLSGMMMKEIMEAKEMVDKLLKDSEASVLDLQTEAAKK